MCIKSTSSIKVAQEDIHCYKVARPAAGLFCSEYQPLQRQLVDNAFRPDGVATLKPSDGEIHNTGSYLQYRPGEKLISDFKSTIGIMCLGSLNDAYTWIQKALWTRAVLEMTIPKGTKYYDITLEWPTMIRGYCAEVVLVGHPIHSPK